MKKKFGVLAILVLIIVLAITVSACNTNPDIDGDQPIGETNYKVTFMSDGAVHAEVTADNSGKIQMPANPVKDGYIFDGWYSDNGVWTNKMTLAEINESVAKGNVVVYAKFIESYLTFDDAVFESKTVTYDGNEHSIQVEGCPEGTEIVYTLSPKQTDVGVYEITARLTKEGYKEKSLTAILTIKAAAFDDAVFENKVVTYDGNAHSIQVEGCPSGTQIDYSISPTQTEAGIYHVVAILEKKGYETKVLEATLIINKAYIDTTKLSFESKEFTEDGRTKSLAVKGDLPYGVTVEYINNDQKHAGVYTVTAHFVYNSNNYHSVEDMVATLTIVTPLTEYKIYYELNGGENSRKNSDTYLSPNAESIELYPASRSAWIFDGWYQNEDFEGKALTKIPKNSSGDIYLYAKWVKPYLIPTDENFIIEGNNVYGTVSSAIDLYNFVESFNACSDCTWSLYADALGTVEMKLKNLEIVHGLNIAYIVVWSDDNSAFTQYTLYVYRLSLCNYTFMTNDIVYEDPSIIDSGVIEEQSYLEAPQAPQKEHYTFEYWTDASGKIVSFPLSMGAEYVYTNAIFYAQYSPIDYSITYDMGDEGSVSIATNPESNPTSYNIESVLDFADSTREGYEFAGWTYRYVDSTETDVVMTAHWKVIEYPISYNYNDSGSASKATNNLNNPLKYTIEDEVTFFEPTRDGYNFLAWDIQGISKGSTGEITVTASWAVIIYTVTYDLAIDENSASQEVDNSTNPTTYTVEDYVKFASPTRKGYNFSSWSKSYISRGTTGDLTITASWKAIAYQINYDFAVANDSASKVVDNSANPTTYTIEDDVIFVDATRSGYNFVQWDIPTIEKGTTGVVTITASWEIVTYSIHYDLAVAEDSASKDVENSANPTTYTVEESVTFAVPTREGYTLTKWSIPSITKGTTGDITTTATWKVVAYTITYTLNGATNNKSNPSTFTIEDLPVTIYDGTFNNDAFNSWRDQNSVEGNKVTSITTIGNKRIYALAGGTEGLGYTLSSDRTYYSVRDYSGTETDVVIGAKYNNKPVKSILSSAFEGKNITSIKMYNSITSIGSGAFAICLRLRSVTIPDSVTTIGYGAFAWCESLTDVYYKGSIAGWCGISFGDDDANPMCCADNVYIDGKLIEGELVIPNRVTTVPSYAFRGCEITKVVIPDSVTTIGNYAFRDCTSLTDVYYEGDIAGWCGISFENSSTNPMYYADNLYIDGKLIEGELIIPNSVTSIGQYAFAYCDSLTSIVIPDSVTTIGNYAFRDCTSLTSVTFGENSQLTTIGLYAFCDCDSLTSIVIPDSVTTINSSAFDGCTSLTSIVIPDSVTTINSSAFDGCTSLTDVYYTGTKKQWKAISISSGNSCVTGATIHYYTVVSENIVDATCVTAGSYDSVIYAHDGKEVSRETIVVSALGHDEIKHNAQAPTCTEVGWNAYVTCSRCDYTTYAEIPATGHTEGTVVVENNVDATCLTDGSYDNVVYCTMCEAELSRNTVVVDALGHDEVQHDAQVPTCTEIGWDVYAACSRCDYTTYAEIPATGHTEGTVVVENKVDARCTTDGSYDNVVYCTVCGTELSRETKTIDTLGHDVIEHDAQAPTCTEIGWGAYVTCSRCDYSTYSEIPATGHSHTSVVTDPTCTEQGYTTHACYCGDSYIDTYIDAIGHIEGAVVVENNVDATCLTDGLYDNVVYCTMCEVELSRNTVVVDALGHDEVEHVAKASTCTENGWNAYVTCSRCDYTTYAEIPSTGHSHTTVVTDPTCLEQGYTTHTCHCGDSYVDLYVEALGHTLGAWRETLAPTLIETGEERRDCEKCDYYETNELPSYGVSGTWGVLTWTLNKNTGELIISGEGTMNNFASSSTDAWRSYSEIIKTVIIKNGVASIGDYAFRNCSSLTSIVIPDSVTSIGYQTFTYCSSLTDAYYLGDIAGWCGISLEASIMSYAKNLYIDGKLVEGELVIPDGVTTIPAHAFNGREITKVTISESVTTIGEDAFGSCSSLIDVYYEGSIAGWCDISFGNYYANTMYYADNLYIDGKLVEGELVIPDSVTTIGSYAFYSCDSLTSVTIGSGVTSIGSSAFSGCYKLVEVYNKSSLNITKGSSDNGYVGYYALNVYTEEGGSKLSTDENGYIIYNDGADKILVSYVGAETDLVIPDGITAINNYAFRNCSSLTSIVIPDSVITIGDYAFYGRSGLISIVIPDSVITIGSSAFYSCHSLISVTIGSGVTSIGSSAFSGCYKLVEVYNKSSLNITKGSTSDGYVGYYALAVYTDEYVSKVSTNEDGYIIYADGADKTLVGYVGAETDLVIPDVITAINNYAFRECTSLTSIVIPDSVTTIGKYAFYYCYSLTSVTIGSGVTSIGEGAFYGCDSLTGIVIPDSVTTIGTSAFKGCTSLTSITLPFVGATKDGTSNTHFGYIFGASSYSYNDDYVPSSLKEVIITGGITIRSSAFYGCISLTSVVIPDSVTSIGNYAFYGCSSLTSIVIPDSVTTIGWGAFSNCTSLTSVTFEDPNGWYITQTEGATSGTNLTLTNASTNATYLKSTYYQCYWYKK